MGFNAEQTMFSLGNCNNLKFAPFHPPPANETESRDLGLGVKKASPNKI